MQYNSMSEYSAFVSIFNVFLLFVGGSILYSISSSFFTVLFSVLYSMHFSRISCNSDIVLFEVLVSNGKLLLFNILCNLICVFNKSIFSLKLVHFLNANSKESVYVISSML